MLISTEPSPRFIRKVSVTFQSLSSLCFLVARSSHHRDVLSLLAGRLCSSLLHKFVTSAQLFSHSGFLCSLELLKLPGQSMSLIQSRRYIF